MVLAILFCLKNKIKFSLSSKRNNFSEVGWSEFFEPFIVEEEDCFHIENNTRANMPKTAIQKIKIFLFKKMFGVQYFTQDLWTQFHCKEFTKEVFDIPELELKGSTREASNVIIKNIWSFQKSIRILIDDKIKELQLPSRYIGIHIRGGDKVTEYSLFAPSDYINLKERVSGLNDIFVATDDFKYIIELKTQFPHYRFYTYCKPKSQGFDFHDYSFLAMAEKRNHLIELFLDIEVLSQSEFFIGTYSSNVGMYLGMRRNGYNCIATDFPEWQIW
jgi:hypothetical protein